MNFQNNQPSYYWEHRKKQKRWKTDEWSNVWTDGQTSKFDEIILGNGQKMTIFYKRAFFFFSDSEWGTRSRKTHLERTADHRYHIKCSSHILYDTHKYGIVLISTGVPWKSVMTLPRNSGIFGIFNKPKPEARRPIFMSARNSNGISANRYS